MVSPQEKAQMYKENGNGWWFGWTSKNCPIDFLIPILKKREEVAMKRRQEEETNK